VRRKTDRIAFGEFFQIDIRTPGFLVDSELQLLVRLGRAADRQQFQ
jgi:hypothetical protein